MTAVAALCTASVLAACTAGVDSASTTDGGAPKELRLAIGGESEDGYDPTLGWGRYGSPLFQSTLLARDPT